MNSNKEDIGVLKDYTFDLAFGIDENNFECTVSSDNNVCESGYYLYYEGSEYGGIIDSVYIDTEFETVKYKGRTWHGIIESKILQPDIDADYLVVSGEANTVLASLISRMGIGALFKVSTEDSGINISSYKMNRYVGGYTGIMKMLKVSNAKLDVAFKKGFVELSASPFIDYSQDEQFDTDQISFTIQKNYKPLNHVICLGQGDLKDRRVIHIYADALGNISGTQTLKGLDEVCAVYDNSNAESDDELKQGGFDMIAAAWASDSIEFNFESDDESFDINDVIGAKELTTDTNVTASITKKIVKIVDNTTTISYECEGNSGSISSGSYPSSGSGGGMITLKNITLDGDTGNISAKTTSKDISNSVANSNYEVALHIGSGGINRGIYDSSESEAFTKDWIIYANELGETVIPRTLKLIKTTDASGVADNRPALIIGAYNGPHLEFDGNEIMAKKTANTVNDLYINNDGGKVWFGGDVAANNGTLSAKTIKTTGGADLDTVKGKIPYLKAYSKIVDNISINAGANKSVTFTVDAAVTGLTRIITNVNIANASTSGANYGNVYAVQKSVSGTTGTVVLHNCGGATAVVAISVHMIYIPSSQ